MTPAYKKKLEKQFDISIFNFTHFSGNYAKAGFSFIYSPNLQENREFRVMVKAKESYARVIKEALEFKKGVWYERNKKEKKQIQKHRHKGLSSKISQKPTPWTHWT